MSTPFGREDDGIRVDLGGPETEALAVLPGFLDAIGDDRSDPAVVRLFPEVHAGDAGAEARYRALVSPGLRRARRDDREAFAASLRRSDRRLTTAEAGSWLRVLGDARLALAARAGVVDESTEAWDRQAPDDPDLALAHYLGYLQGELAEVLLEGFEAGERT